MQASCGLCQTTSNLSLQTLPSAIARQAKRRRGTESQPLLADSPHPAAPAEPVPPLRALFVRPVLISLLNHGFLCFCHMANEVLTIPIPLFHGMLIPTYLL
jgi:hypothetical protein